MRSNVALHARKSLPTGRASFEIVRGYDATRTRVRVTRGREMSGRRPRIPMRIKKQTPAARRRETHYNTTYLRNQP